MKKIKIWVDDIRPASQGYIHLHSVNETIDYLSNCDPMEIEVLNIDHDAGDYVSKGGDYIKILDWLEFVNISIPISIHSKNPVGIKNMMTIIKKNNWKYI